MLPPTIVGDMAGGAMFLLFRNHVRHARGTSIRQGRAVDAAMIDGVSAMSGLMHQMRSGMGYWKDDPAQNHFQHFTPSMKCSECADGKHITLGAIEPLFMPCRSCSSWV